jgi:hypothetical protein
MEASTDRLDVPIPPRTCPGPTPGPRLTVAGTLYGAELRDARGEVLGTVSDVLLDLACGRIAYLLLATGGFVGLGERYLTVPWTAVGRDQHGGLVLERPRAAFETGPAFEREQLPWMPTPGWHRFVHAHYRSPPYWD